MPYSAIILFIVSVSGAIFSYFLLRSERKIINILFSVFSIVASLWALFLGQFIITGNLDNALLYTNIYYVAAAAIPLIFFYFSLFFKREEIKFKKSSLLFITPLVLLALGFIFNQNLIIDEIFSPSWQSKDFEAGEKPKREIQFLIDQALLISRLLFPSLLLISLAFL